MSELPEIERSQFLSALHVAKNNTDQTSVPFGLLLVDLSNLGDINRREGYDFGDSLLSAAYQSLCSVSKADGLVFRINSHGFAFILPELKNPAFIALAVNRVRQVLHEGLSQHNAENITTINIGLSLGRPEHRDYFSALSRAEASLKQVKLGISSGIEEMLAENTEKPTAMRLEQYFSEALSNGTLELYYQPKIDARTGQVDGAEALLRWELEGYGKVPPEQVVQMAEASGKVYELCKWVINRALRQHKQWAGSFDLPIAVNVPPSMVSRHDLSNMVHDALKIWGVPAHKLAIEITEEAVVDDKEMGFDVLRGIRD